MNVKDFPNANGTSQSGNASLPLCPVVSLDSKKGEKTRKENIDALRYV